MEIFFWVINGFLIIIYLLIQNWTVALVVPGTVLLAVRAPTQYRPWMLATIGMASSLALLMPQAGIRLALMVWAGIGACRLEHFNPDMLRWRVNTTLSLYSLLGLGYLLLRYFSPYLGSGAVGIAQPMMSGGEDYFRTVAEIGLLWILPAGFFALIGQAIFTMPPVRGRPADMITEIRTRGRTEDETW
jgi:hypothetical protein